jgi:hypothetical protein
VKNKTKNNFSPYPHDVLKALLICIQGSPSQCLLIAGKGVDDAGPAEGCRARLPGKAAGQGCRARPPGNNCHVGGSTSSLVQVTAVARQLPVTSAARALN